MDTADDSTARERFPDYSVCIECGVRIPATDDACDRCIMGPDYGDGFHRGTAARERFNEAERARWNR